MAIEGAQSELSFLATLAENSQSAPISALVWWIIPIVALSGGLLYAFWVSKLKTKFDNQTDRSVTRFQKFQKSFQEKSTHEHLDDKRSPRDRDSENGK